MVTRFYGFVRNAETRNGEISKSPFDCAKQEIPVKAAPPEKNSVNFEQGDDCNPFAQS